MDEDRDPLLGNMTRRYLDAQNNVAKRTAVLVKVRNLLRGLKDDVCVNRIAERNALMNEIDEVLK